MTAELNTQALVTAVGDAVADGNADVVQVLIEIKELLKQVVNHTPATPAVEVPTIPIPTGRKASKETRKPPEEGLPLFSLGSEVVVYCELDDGACDWFEGVVVASIPKKQMYTVKFADGDEQAGVSERLISTPEDEARMEAIAADTSGDGDDDDDEEEEDVATEEKVQGPADIAKAKQKAERAENDLVKQKERDKRRKQLLKKIPYTKEALLALKRQDIVMLAAALGVEKPTDAATVTVPKVLKAQKKYKAAA